jgi:CheY-like chemotaxis protein
MLTDSGSGCWFIKHLRQLDEHRGGRIPAVALTSLTGPEDKLRILEAGFQLHVGKPFDPDTIIDAVRNLIECVSSAAPGLIGPRYSGIG